MTGVQTCALPILPAVPHNLAVPLRQVLGFAGVLAQHHESLDSSEIDRLARQILSASCRISRRLASVGIQDRWKSGITAGLLVKGEPLTCAPKAVLNRAVAQCTEGWSREGDVTIAAQSGQVRLTESILSFTLTELLDNALRYSRPGTRIEVSGEIGRAHV